MIETMVVKTLMNSKVEDSEVATTMHLKKPSVVEAGSFKLADFLKLGAKN